MQIDIAQLIAQLDAKLAGAGCKRSRGDCYEVSLFLLLVSRGAIDSPVLVHGEPKLQTTGALFGHAWVEASVQGVKFAFDFSSLRSRILPVEYYYQRGEIDPKHCKRYAPEAAIKKAKQKDNCGPWHESQRNVLYAS